MMLPREGLWSRLEKQGHRHRENFAEREREPTEVDTGRHGGSRERGSVDPENKETSLTG